MYEPKGGPSDRRRTCGASAGRPPLGGERRLELGLEALLRHRADDLGGDLAVLEEDHRRNRQDLEGGGGLLVVVDVELDDLQRVALLAGDLLEHRGDHAARTAPRGPEVDEDGRVSLEHLGLEVRVGDFGDGCHAAFSGLLAWTEDAGDDLASQSIARTRRVTGSYPTSASRTRGVTHTSMAAAASSIGTAIPTVTNVAAS